MNPDREDWWFPEYEYTISLNGQSTRKTYTVEDVSTNECPVSLITPQTQKILELDSRNRRAKEASGASFCGTDSGQWPAWWWDAVTLIESQRVLAESARLNAE